MQIQKSFQAVERQNKTFKKASLTVPNQSLTVRDILKKYSGNVALAIKQNPVYEDDPVIDYPNPLRYTPDPLTTGLELTNELDELRSKLQPKMPEPVVFSKPKND
ncbi:MAG: hypothetical protein [Arizlama microvirus]|nr:MAG: hypothetical protein [Arizlama microvirus]